MNVFINGKSIALAVQQGDSNTQNKGAVIEHALTHFLNADQQERTFAVALNSEFVGRDDYSSTPIKEGDSIDVLFPIQGG